MRRDRDQAAGPFRVRRGPGVPAAGSRTVPAVRVDVRGHHPAGRSDVARLARSARQQRGHRHDRPQGGTGDEAGLHRPRRGRQGRQGFRTPAVCHPQDHAEGRARFGHAAEAHVPRAEPVVPHDDLQGAPRRGPDRGVLPGPDRPEARQRPRARPPALQHEHVPDVEPRPAVPLPLPQRRDQHAEREHQLDERAPGPVQDRPVRLEHVAPLPDPDPRRERLRDARQRRRAPLPHGPPPAPRDHDAHPGSVAEPQDHERREAGILRIPLLHHGAVGRPRVDPVHRWPVHRRGARPQRPPAVALHRHQGRLRRHGVRDRRARDRSAERPLQGAASAGPHAARGHGQGPDRG